MFNRSRFRQRFDGAVVAGLTEGTLVAPYFFAAPLALSRAQTGGVQSSAVGADGSSLTFYGADTPRFTGASQRLLLEGQATNTINNTNCQGAVAGSPGTYPTGWFVNGNGEGLNWNVVGSGRESEIPYVDLRLSGTSTGTAFASVTPEPFSGSASPGQIWTSSLYFRRVAGSLTGITAVNLLLIQWNSAAGFLRESNTSISANSASLFGGRRSLTDTMGASTAIVSDAVYVFPSAGVPVDVTFRFGAPQLKQLPFADTPSFPPVGTLTDSTRGVDLVSPSLASLGLAANGACAVLWSGVIPNFITGGVHTIACIDDGSVNNRFTMRVDQASGQLQAMRALAGASATANAGAVIAGVSFKGGMNIDGAGRAGVSLNGNAVAAVTGGPTSGLTQLRLGNIFDGSTPIWGETARFRVIPFVSDAELQTLVSALP